jgi:hypothetical protein
MQKRPIPKSDVVLSLFRAFLSQLLLFDIYGHSASALVSQMNGTVRTIVGYVAV